MIWWLVGLAAGAAAGIFLPAAVPSGLVPYIAVLALLLLDGALSAALPGQRSGQGASLLLAAGVACLIVYLGVRLEAPLYLAVCAGLCARIFGRVEEWASARENSPFLPEDQRGN